MPELFEEFRRREVSSLNIEVIAINQFDKELVEWKVGKVYWVRIVEIDAFQEACAIPMKNVLELNIILEIVVLLLLMNNAHVPLTQCFPAWKMIQLALACLRLAFHARAIQTAQQRCDYPQSSNPSGSAGKIDRNIYARDVESPDHATQLEPNVRQLGSTHLNYFYIVLLFGHDPVIRAVIRSHKDTVHSVTFDYNVF
ncbi:hypothetical protein LTS18_007515 [Coniosporium uncinatum]|uniref:Uncharacterized protein n=1 Tax=Coniosporium uncinatum TaxID=93489 RepID=A0ACC3D2R5_9PEZI|nr:hypothetical protein LTS18_007515 [Coniosporium uncinatum]